MTKDWGFVPLSKAQIEELRQYDTPTIANALELFQPWDRVSGIMSPRIQALFPEKKTMIGYASTFLFSSRHPARGKLYADWFDYYRYVPEVPEPRVSIGQDIDPAPAIGSMWGEVQANIHYALGCVGVVLEGAMRDLDGMRALEYPCFAREVVLGHGYAHVVEYGHPVEVGGVVVHPGDLVCGDKHGIIVIPHDAAPHLAALCRKILESEARFLAIVRDRKNFSVERLVDAYALFMEEFPVEELRTV